jgi:predicted DNA-binding transcriptional regulator AlpA
VDDDRWVRVRDLVSAEEIADRLGYAHAQSVSVLRQRHESFPQPVAKSGRVMIWVWPDVEEWARATGRYPPEDGTSR